MLPGGGLFIGRTAKRVIVPQRCADNAGKYKQSAPPMHLIFRRMGQFFCAVSDMK